MEFILALRKLCAVELKTQVSLWNEISDKKYSLFYIRDKGKKEVDFLITMDNKPWLLIEAKCSDSPVDRHCLDIQRMLGEIPLVQICMQKNICLQQNKDVYRISAARFLR
jgi:hypothetical protein